MKDKKKRIHGTRTFRSIGTLGTQIETGHSVEL